jgi:uncharacterized membrane protein YgcG
MVFRNIALCALLCLPVMAQSTNPLVGVWERISLMRGGVEGQPPAAPEFLIVSADGYYSESELPEGRDKVSKPLSQMTKEELVARYERTAASRGTYTIMGNVFDRVHIADLNPGAEGTHQTRSFRFEGDILVLYVDAGTGAGGPGGGRGGSGRGGGRGGSGAGPFAGGRGGSGRAGGGGALVVRFKRMKL